MGTVRTAVHVAVCVCHLHKWLAAASGIKDWRVRVVADEKLPAGNGGFMVAVRRHRSGMFAANMQHAHGASCHEDLQDHVRALFSFCCVAACHAAGCNARSVLV